MRIYFAPMEGLTDSIYRRLHHKFFPGIDRYYMPFLSPTIHRTLTHKEQRELPVAQSESFTAVPQILTKVADDFLWAAQICADRGYDEVNLNLGCPSGTVVAKGKGSGMLRDLDLLDAFLEKVCRHSPLPVSVKTRLGLEQPEEFLKILEVYNRYPIRELTIHPRVRKQIYTGTVDMDIFAYAVRESKLPLCYNGDLASLGDIRRMERDFPRVGAVMLGRGLIGDPGMLTGTTAKYLEPFMAQLLEAYIDTFGSSRNAMFRLKENWHAIIPHFSGSEKLWKQLRKCTDLAEYRDLTAQIFHTLTWT